MEAKKISITINGREIEASEGERLVEIIQRLGLFLPHPCYHKLLSESGHCGMCLVGARRQRSDAFSVVLACTATAKDGMEVDIEFSLAAAERNRMLIAYLASHPMDCAKCDKVGRCFLHKFSTQTKFRGFSRIRKGKLIDVDYKDLGGGVLLDDYKCIGCKRCIRFCRDVLGEDILGFLRDEENGIKFIRLYPGKTLGGTYSQNLVDLCPAGALINKNYTFQPPEWTLIATPSISTESSVGINTYVLHKENKIFRIVPRENPNINGLWMTNSAREEHQCFESTKRLTKSFYNGKSAPLESVVTYVVKILSSSSTTVVCSGNMSVEDQFVLRQLLNVAPIDLCFLRKSRDSDGFLISSDATPNLNGAVMNYLATDSTVCDDLKQLNDKVNNGQCQCIISLNEEIFAKGISYSIPSSLKIIYIGVHSGQTAKRANAAIPIATFFETTGTFINKDWRLQRFVQAVDSPKGNILPLYFILALILRIYAPFIVDDWRDLNYVWQALSSAYDLLAGIELPSIPFGGILLKTR